MICPIIYEFYPETKQNSHIPMKLMQTVDGVI